MRQKIEKYDHDLKIQYSNIELWTIANLLVYVYSTIHGRYFVFLYGPYKMLYTL